MKRLLRSIYNTFTLFFANPRKAVRATRQLFCYFRDWQTLKRQEHSAVNKFPWGKPYPCLADKSSDSGAAKGHYFHQDLLVARRIHQNSPHVHVDVGSRIDGFVAHVAAFRPIEVFDIRPLSSTIPNIRFVQADLMAPLKDPLIDYCDSVSCLHALEHFGLGRYGDPVNYDGYLLGLDSLRSLLKKGGKLYLSVPIGPQRIEFNAHRVFSVDYLLKCIAGKYRLDQFSFVDDKGDLHENMLITEAGIQNNFGCVYGCGIWELTKL